MFYRFSSIALALVGFICIIMALKQGRHLDTTALWAISVGMATLLIGVLNFVYLYEAPQSSLPKIILLGANGLFIGYLILLITNHAHLLSSYVSVALVFITSILILNKKV